MSPHRKTSRASRHKHPPTSEGWRATKGTAVKAGLVVALWLGILQGATVAQDRSLIQEFQLSALPGVHDAIPFYYRMPAGPGAPAGVLLLVPGCNGSGLAFPPGL